MCRPTSIKLFMVYPFFYILNPFGFHLFSKPNQTSFAERYEFRCFWIFGLWPFVNEILYNFILPVLARIHTYFYIGLFISKYVVYITSTDVYCILYFLQPIRSSAHSFFRSDSFPTDLYTAYYEDVES